MDAIVECVAQRTARVSDAGGPTEQPSSVVDSAAIKSDSFDQNPSLLSGDQKTLPASHSDVSSTCSQTVSDKVETGLASLPQLMSSDKCPPSAKCHETALHGDDLHSTDVSNFS